jgi:hypothetical protein
MYDSNSSVIQEAALDPTVVNLSMGTTRTRAGQIKKTDKVLLPTQRRSRLRYNDPNNFAPLPGGATGHPFGDEIVIRVDRFSDEATCKSCDGLGHSVSTCPDCGGKKGNWYDANGNKDNRLVDRTGFSFINCASCKASQYGDPIPRSTGKVPCQPCRGTGQLVGDSGIVISTAYEDQPTTGVVLAIGPQAKRVSRGMRVLFSRFAGQEYETEGRKYRIMKDMYPMMEVRGKGDIRVREAAMVR